MTSRNGADELTSASRACRSAMLVMVAFSACVNVLMLAAPLYMLQVFDRVLTKKPTDRYQSAERFARDLRDVASGRWYLVKLSNRLGLPTAPPTRPEPVAKPVPPAPRPTEEHGPTMPLRTRQLLEQTLIDPWAAAQEEPDDPPDDDDDDTQIL